MLINNKVNHIFYKTWGVLKHILYLCMFAKVLHGILLSSIYVQYIIVGSKFSDNSIILRHWLNGVILIFYLTLQISVQHSNFNYVNVLTTMQ